MPLAAKKIAVLHVGKAKLGIPEEGWRALLMRVAGVESSKDLDRQGFEDMCAALEALGFKSDFGKAHGGNLRHWTKASPGQLALIEDLWAELHGGELDRKALDRWLERFGISSLRFLERDRAGAVIAALKSWKGRIAGRPDREAS